MKTIIFDMYGVIMKDPYGNLMPFINRLYPDKKAEDVYPFWKEAGEGRISSREFWERIGCGDEINNIERAYLDTIEINEGFYKAAAGLQVRYRFALLTNDISEWSAYLRGKYDLDRHFDVIAGSGDIGMSKPDPEIFAYILDKLCRSASECVFIDDGSKNLSAAREAGMEVILFNSRSEEYDGTAVTSFDELIGLFP
jgi:putative hydrolase of the HAD superfamily